LNTSQDRVGNFSQIDQTQKYEIQIDGSDRNSEMLEKGMPMFYESRDYGFKTVTIDKLSQKDQTEEGQQESPPFNLEDDSLNKNKFGEFIRQNAGLKVQTSISTYDREL